MTGTEIPLQFESFRFRCPKCRVEIVIPHLGDLPPNLEIVCPRCGVKIVDIGAHIETIEFNPSRR